MIKVNQTAKTLEEGVKTLMMEGAKQDYVRCSTSDGRKELTGYSKEQVDKWDKIIKISNGKKYIKVVRENGVFAFIVKEDFKHFKKGDILKLYNAPALNQPRGNVLSENYMIQWTDLLYLN